MFNAVHSGTVPSACNDSHYSITDVMHLVPAHCLGVFFQNFSFVIWQKRLYINQMCRQLYQGPVVAILTRIVTDKRFLDD